MAPELANDIAELKRWLLVEQWGLTASSHDGYTEVSGIYFVKSPDKEIYASGPLAKFEICLKIFDDHPYSTPILKEVGGVIKNISGNHVNLNGTICYGPPKFVWASNPSMSLIRFFEEYIHSYFIGYLYYQEHGVWPQGEYEHGNPGVLTAYAELLKCKPSLYSVKGMLKLLSLKYRRDRWMCPCRSGKKLGKCCRPALNEAGKKIKKIVAKKLLLALNDDYY